MKVVKKIWHWVRWPLLVLVVAYAALVAYRIPAVGEKQKTATAIADIQSQKITMADVLGTALPPQPYEPENDATVAGIDKNNNGIRDDVELAIFKEYPNSAKIRAAELQYAMTEQMFLTNVFNTDTWKAVAEEDSRSSYCISETATHPTLSDSNEVWKNWSKLIDSRTKEVESLVLNTQARKNALVKADSFITSYGSSSGGECDVDLNSLPN
jgi:DUF438 domain-containing protein